jgi:hypothetical protein
MYKSLEHTIRMIAEGRMQEPETFLEAKGVHDQEVHDHYQWLKGKPTSDVLKMHRARHRITHNYSANDAGGKDAMISGLMRDKFGNKRVAAHFGLDEDINNTDKFVGNNQTDKPVPVIKPNATQDAKRASLTRANAKERTSQTMGGNVEEETLDERNQANAMKRKMMDASRGAKYKLNNPVPDREPEHKTAQAHNKAIGRALRSEDSLQEKSAYHVSWGPGVEHEVLAHHGDEAIEKAKQHIIAKTPKLKDPKYADTFAKKPAVHNLSKERKLQEGGVLDTADKAAEYVVPYYSAAKKLYKGDRAGAAQDAAIDTGLLAVTGGVGKLVGGAAKAGGKLLGGALRTGERAGIKTGEKAALTGAEKAATSAAEKDVAKVAATDAEKGAAKTAAVDAEKAAGKSAGIGARTAARTGLRTAAAAAALSRGNGRINTHVNATQHGNFVSHKPSTSASMAKRHRVAEETGTDARETIEAMPRSDIKDRKDVQYVGRPDSASSPMDKRSVLIRQEIQKKVIDEEVKKKADTIKKVMKEKQDKGNTATDKETSLGDGKTKVVGDVIINPKLNPQDYTGNVVP